MTAAAEEDEPIVGVEQPVDAGLREAVAGLRRVLGAATDLELVGTL
jgi:hypothetical protein